MSTAPGSISLSLVSHTNAGKTTLARTLLGRDVGIVRDAPHVTEFADVYTMLEAPGGERLLLWDTPGFGDSVRLVKRLRASGNPLGWFMSQVWDRWRDKPFWATQQAMRNVRDEADAMLYLVNAAEPPEAAGYVGPEMELLGWLEKPVVVLLNQLGAPQGGGAEEADAQRWRAHLAAWPQVRSVLPLDAFARCWVQERTLLRAIEHALAASQQGAMARLAAAWQAERLRTFEASIDSLAQSLARLGAASAEVPDAGSFGARLRRVGQAVGLGDGRASPAQVAQTALAERFDAEVKANTLELIRLHGLEGKAQGEILTRLATRFETRLKLDEGRAALWGGMVSGALVGLKADILSGGLTLGGGLLAGGLIGALGAAGLARCVNLVRGTDRSWVAWNAEALDQMLVAALLRYLAVAHFGRGRGEWAEGEAPPHWRELIERTLAPHRDALAAIWRERDVGEAPPAPPMRDRMAGAFGADRLDPPRGAGPLGRDGEHGGGGPGAAASDAPGAGTEAESSTAERLAAALEPIVAATLADALVALYPDAADTLLPARAGPLRESAQPGLEASQ